MDTILDTTDVSYFTIVTCKGTPHFLHASLSVCDQLLKIFCHQAMHQPKNVAMVFLFCGRGSTQCIRVFVMRSKGLAFLQSFMLLMCSQKKEVHSLKFLKIKALCASWQCFSIWGMKDPHYEVLMLVEMLSTSSLPSIYLADPSLFH